MTRIVFKHEQIGGCSVFRVDFTLFYDDRRELCAYWQQSHPINYMPYRYIFPGIQICYCKRVNDFAEL